MWPQTTSDLQNSERGKEGRKIQQFNPLHCQDLVKFNLWDSLRPKSLSGVPPVAQWRGTWLASMRTQVQSLALLSQLGIWHCCELWCRLATTAPIGPPVFEPPCVRSAALKSKKKAKKIKVDWSKSENDMLKNGVFSRTENAPKQSSPLFPPVFDDFLVSPQLSVIWRLLTFLALSHA